MVFCRKKPLLDWCLIRCLIQSVLSEFAIARDFALEELEDDMGTTINSKYSEKMSLAQ